MLRRRASEVIRDDQVEKIKESVESIDSTPIMISMIRNYVWAADSGSNFPSNSTISKIVKKRLNMSFKILQKWSTKRNDEQNQRLLIESLYMQAQLKENSITAIFIDEFKFS